MNNFKFYAFTRFKLGIGATACHAELAKVYADEAPGKSTIYRWYSDFPDTGGHLNPKNIDGLESSESGEEDDDEEEAAVVSPGRPRTTRTAEKVTAIQEYLEIDCQMSVRELADACEIDKSTVHRILRKDLGLRNVASVWVPHELSDLNKQNRVNCAENLRRHFHQEGMESFCNKYAVQDETWVYLKGQPRKQQNRAWLTPTQPRPQVIRRTLADKKVMVMIAFTPNKRFSITAVPPNERINSDKIIEFVRHTGDLWRCLRSNPMRLSDVLWQWDNARPHSARATRDFMEGRNISMIFQSPYSPDLNLCDRFLFNWLKADFCDNVFRDHLELQQAALQWARQLDENALQREVQKLMDHCQAVIDARGDYVTD
jgi:hypothetical protein